jgi:hypothetical protein
MFEPHHQYRSIGKVEHRSRTVIADELTEPYLVFGHAYPLGERMAEGIENLDR